MFLFLVYMKSIRRMYRILNHTKSRLGRVVNHLEPTARMNHVHTRLFATTPCLKDEVKAPMKSDEKNKAPIKFTTSQAYLNYRSSDNFYGGDDRDLPKSHNLVLAGTGILATYYLIFLRDDIEADGGKALFTPLHESVPELAIPIIQSAIAENRKFGLSTEKLEKKLEELMKEPEKHGGGRHKLIEN